MDGSVSVTFTRMSSALVWLKLPFLQKGGGGGMFFNPRQVPVEHEFNKWPALGWF